MCRNGSLDRVTYVRVIRFEIDTDVCLTDANPRDAGDLQQVRGKLLLKRQNVQFDHARSIAADGRRSRLERDS